jgi:hypothetical protein
MSKRIQEPVDQWLAKEGYFRKPTPRDPTCLFRAISEQVYYTQYYHLRVRRECTTFMMRMRHLFEKVKQNLLICTHYIIHTIIHAIRLLYIG